MSARLDVTREEAEAHIGQIDHFLALGHPVETKPGDRTAKSAIRLAADLLGINRVTFAYRIGKPDAPGAYFREFHLRPDWSIAAARGEFCARPAMAGYAVKAVATQRDAEGNLEREWVQQTRAPGPVEAVPDGHVVKGVSILQDGQGRTLAKWVKTREGSDPIDVVETIKAALDWAKRHEPVRSGLASTPYPWWRDGLNVEWSSGEREHTPTLAELARTLLLAERHRSLGGTAKETANGTLAALWAIVLTGQRAGALTGTLRATTRDWPERPGWKVWTWTREEMKGGRKPRPHAIPVPPEALEVLARFPVDAESPFLFPSRVAGK